MDCPARQLCNYFTSTILLTRDFCGTLPRATIKTTHLMQWHGTICIVKVFLLSEREISPNYTGFFLDFVHGFGSYVKGLPKTKRCNSVAVTVSVRFRFGFGVYVKQPLGLCDKTNYQSPFFCLVFAMPMCASVYMCFVVTCWERADLLALVCGV